MSRITWRFLCFHIITGHTGLIFYTSLNISDRGSEGGKLIASTQWSTACTRSRNQNCKEEAIIKWKNERMSILLPKQTETITELSLYRFFYTKIYLFFVM